MATQVSLFDNPTPRRAAEARLDLGIARSTEHAERSTPGWNELAMNAFRAFLRDQKKPFVAEEFVAWASGRLPDPPDKRAFGGVVQRAARAGLIRKIGYAPAATSNCSPKCQWEKTC